MPSAKVLVAMLLRDALRENDAELIGGMMLLEPDQRARLFSRLITAQQECQTPEVRYVSSADSASSGDEIK